MLPYRFPNKLVNINSSIQLSRADDNIYINPLNYTGSEPMRIDFIGEVLTLNEWWYTFWITFITMPIIQFIYSFSI